MESGGLVIILDKFGINVPLLGIQTINFLLVAYLLYRFVFRGVMQSMDERNKQIQDGLKYGEEMKAELANIENKRIDILSQANAEASGIIGNARKSATELLEKEKQSSKELAQNIVSKARDDIQNERNAMFDGLKSELKELIVQATEKVLARKLSESGRTKYREQAVQTLAQML